MFKYTYHCPTCGYDCVTWFYEQPYANATFTCCCDNDILIDSVDTEKKEMVCIDIASLYNGYIEAR